MRCGCVVLSLYLISGAYVWSVHALEPREILSPTTSGSSSVPQQSSTTLATRSLSSEQLTGHEPSSTRVPPGSPTSDRVTSTELSPTQSILDSATSAAAESSHSLSPSSTYGTAVPSVAQATYTASNGTKDGVHLFGPSKLTMTKAPISTSYLSNQPSLQLSRWPALP